MREKRVDEGGEGRGLVGGKGEHAGRECVKREMRQEK